MAGRAPGTPAQPHPHHTRAAARKRPSSAVSAATPTKFQYVPLDSVPGPSPIKQCYRTVKSLRRIPLLPGSPQATTSAARPEESEGAGAGGSGSGSGSGSGGARLQKRHSCGVCHKKFGSPGKLSQHQLLHTGALPFECPHCDKRFNSKFKLVRHVLIHNETRPFSCTHCSRTFHRKDHLANHARVHNPVKNVYVCERPDCKKQYTSLLNFRKHAALHSAEEGDLDCKICFKRFDNKADIVFHLKVHAGSRTVKNETDKKFTCTDCDRKFFTAKDVRRHHVVHTGSRDFVCQFCPQKFGRKDHLVRHVKKAHSQEFPRTAEPAVATAFTPSDAPPHPPNPPDPPERRKGKGEGKRTKPETRPTTRRQTESFHTEKVPFESPLLLPDPSAVLKPVPREEMFIACEPIEVKDEPREAVDLETVPSIMTLSSPTDPTPSTSGMGKYGEAEPYPDMMYMLSPYQIEEMLVDTIDYGGRTEPGDMTEAELAGLTSPSEDFLVRPEPRPLPHFNVAFQNTTQSPKPQQPPK